MILEEENITFSSFIALKKVKFLITLFYMCLTMWDEMDESCVFLSIT